MREAVIVEAVRVATGKRDGKLATFHPADLLAHVLGGLVERSGIAPELVDDCIAGCVSQIGEQTYNIARNAWLGAGLPESVPATTIDRQCGSSQQAVHFAAQGVIAGAYEVAIACGVESMSRAPSRSWGGGPRCCRRIGVRIGSSTAGQDPFGQRMSARYEGALVHQGLSAELIAEHWEVSREECDEIALASHQRAARATASGAFSEEILPIKVPLDDGSLEDFVRDEGIRPDTSPEALARLKPAFSDKASAVVTAGNASQISDGAAALLVTTPQKAKELNLTPRWRLHTFALAGTDPVTMLTGPIPATRKALTKAQLRIEDIDHFEINEAFAPVIAAWLRELRADPDRVNPRGGAIALGHPLGASGARLMTTMCHALEQTGGRFGLQSMCEGGGLANATIVERLG